MRWYMHDNVDEVVHSMGILSGCLIFHSGITRGWSGSPKLSEAIGARLALPLVEHELQRAPSFLVGPRGRLTCNGRRGALGPRKSRAV